MATRRRTLLLLVGVVGVAALLFLASGLGDPPPRSFMAGLLPELVAEDIEMDAASGLPIVPVAPAARSWWWVDEPDDALDARQRFASAAPISADVDPALRGVTLLARFGDHAAARSVAEGLADAVGDPAAESAWLIQAGQAPGGSFDWQGGATATAPFVQVIDGWLLVSGLTYREPFDAWGTSPDGEPVYRSPLTLALAQQADPVLVEGDRVGEGAVAFDAICHGAPGKLHTMSQDLADHGLLQGWQPPWLAPGITDDQRRARRTLRLMRQLQGAAFGRVLLEDPEFERLGRALSAAADSGDAVRLRAASEDLSAYIVRALPTELPDLGPIASALDPEIVAGEVARYARLAVAPTLSVDTPAAGPTEGERRREAQPYGASQAPIPWRSGDAFFEVSLEGDELSLFAGSWLGIAEGLGPLVDYLALGGCTDLEFVFLDFDDVRGD